MLNSLSNPKTTNYKSLKEYIFSDTFSWVHYEQSTPIDAIENCDEIFKYKRTGFDPDQHGNVPYYVRTYLKRPEADSYPKLAHANSQETDSVITVINEILKANEIEISTFLRISINCVHPCKDITYSLPHLDHQCPHGNLLIYFTDAGGRTFVQDDETVKYHDYTPKEDDVIIFTGRHFMETPSENRRVILVATFV